MESSYDSKGAFVRIIIKDTSSSAEADFPLVRWSFFLSCMADIDKAITQLKEAKEEFKFHQHCGGGWYVSVTSGYWCVDLRRFFMNKEGEIKATRHGIALRLREWKTLKDVLEKITPDLSNTIGCFHEDMEDWVSCKECFPYQSSTSSP